MSLIRLRSTAGRFEVVALVASLGGLAAVSEVLAALPAGFPTQLLVVQHGRRQDNPHRLTGLLQKVTTLPVRTAHDGMSLDAPAVTVIPPGCLASLDRAHHLALTDADIACGGDSLLTSLAVPTPSWAQLHA